VLQCATPLQFNIHEDHLNQYVFSKIINLLHVPMVNVKLGTNLRKLNFISLS